ncbi:D-alanyl-D-alanine carboxypeptidase family protein [Anaerostipes sp.]|uniref:D-alanyl-D-alanine carboxypeptidase family protein n=1 Tax=Anaerostipes sp. TaxID=1872530 RepID=UPI0025BA8BAC|nr:D-alanyl-D-alanine carboxypeptidase family protein [Anaerostipes sp.]MBS7008152.1 D-alanyl-D-alanine carboxypeptidase [Anaerostipes sp.]
MKKAAIFILSLLVCISSGTVVSATEPETLLTVAQDEEGLELTAKSAVVMEAGSGTVLYQKDKDLELPPASVTKVMSLLLIFEEIDKGNLKYTDKVTVSEHAASMGGSQVFLEPGESQTVDTMLKCIVISSANDAVVSMAEHIAGSEGAFVKRMNEKAKQLGMKHTVFKNSCGLDIKGHETSAFDIALMSRELTTKHPDIFKYTKIWMDKFTHETKKGTKEFGLSNTNKLLKQYNGCTGLKTGSTSTAKFCLSATATRNGVSLIAVVMASDDSKARVKDASALLDYGFSHCQVMEDHTKGKDIGKITVAKGKKETVSYDQDIPAKIVLVKGSKNDVKKQIRIGQVKAPVKKGQVLGYIIYKRGDEVLLKKPVKAAESVEKMNYLTSLTRLARQYF